MRKHLTADELVDRLYRVTDSNHPDSGHLDDCMECAERFRQMQARREMAAGPPPESHEFLAAQRRKIYARLGERPETRIKWIPALAAAACLIVVGVAINRPSQAPSSMQSPMSSQVARTEVDDAQLFADVYSMEQSMEPLAAKPIHTMFEQDQQ